MKLAFISDIHSNLEALQAVMAEIGNLKVDEVLCLGDLVGYGADPNHCVEIIRSHGIACVMGNHDLCSVTFEGIGRFNPIAAKALEWTRGKLKPSNISFLKTLPITLKKHGVFLCHGSPADPIHEYVYPSAPDSDFIKYFRLAGESAIAMGHTHVPFFRKFGDRKLAFNPGGVGQPRDSNPKASFCVLDTETLRGEIIRVDYDIDAAAKKIIRAGLPKFLAERLYLGA